MSAHVEARQPCEALPFAASQAHKRPRGSIHRIGGVVTSALAAVRRKRSLYALGELPDYLLEDIGLNRGDALDLMRRG